MGNIIGISCCQFTGIICDNNVSCTCLRGACSVRESFRSLKTEWNKLKSERDDVLTMIDREECEHRRRLQAVVHWLSQVKSIQTDFNKLETDYSKQSANKCSFKFFKTSYTFWKNMARVRKDVESASKSKPVDVTQGVAILPHVEIPVEQPIIGMHSMLDQVWSYMENDEFGIIGLHGMGGVGKTTLMKGLNNKLCNNSTQSFDVVFWIVVSSTPSLSKVQNDIGSVLGFRKDEWKDKNQEEKTNDIYAKLKQKKYVLFLDDVWERIDLPNLGVPLPDENNKSKIVLTTRSMEVCGQMGVDKTIQVTCLEEEAAWDLFRKKAGEKTINGDPEIQAIAKRVAKECDGLPLALIVIGRAMACQTTPREWKTALQKLQNNKSLEFQGMEVHVLRLLKFSYDSISNDSMKSCFLYCSLYPEDCLISKADIVDKWIYEGFLDKGLDLHDARNEGYGYIDTLVHVSLLEESNLEVFTMHDIVREMANWIGCECGEIKNKFYVRAGVGLTKTPNVTEFEGSERMSLMKNEINEITGKPNCPNLLTLFLNENKLNYIENGFFGSMKNLRVLDLSYNWNLKEIPEEVFNLVTLQYLNISPVSIKLGNLINLKWLGIQNHREGILPLPVGVLSSLKKLQVLDASRGFNSLIPKTSMEEMESLEHLEDLRIMIENDVLYSALSSSHKLANIITSLLVFSISSTNLDLLFSQKMVNLHYLYIYGCQKFKYVMSRKIDGTSTTILSSLKTLFISNCPKLMDITVLTFAPNLESIQILACKGMKELCGEWEEGSPFLKLKTLYLWDLPELEIIYPNTRLLFPCLKYMHISNCSKLRKLPFNSSSCNSGNGFTIEGEEEWWNGLEWEDEATRNAFLHSFKPELFF